MTSFYLKILALIFMLIDHIGVFIPGAPIYLRWIGRLSAPLFIFCSTWSYGYTSNKKKYFIRLYIAGVIMAVIQTCLQIDNNFFRTLFSMCIIISLIESYRNKDKYFKKKLLIYCAWQIISIFLCVISLENLWISEEFGAYFLPALFGNIFYLEGGLVFVFLGVLLHLLKNKKTSLFIGYTWFCIFYFCLTATSFLPILLGKLYCWGFTVLSDIIEYLLTVIIGLNPMSVGGSIFTQNFQWMMILALPLMFTYNKKRGKNIKYFFYIFYPAHILVLFYLGKILSF